MRNNLTLIIVLMAISFIGIIGIQVFWMQKTIKEKEEQFEYLVSDALDKFALRIEKKQNAKFLSEYLKSNKIQQNINLSSSNNSINSFFNFWNQVPAPEKSISTPDKNNVTIKVDKKNGSKTVSYGFDTTIIKGNSTQHIKTYSSVTSGSGISSSGFENMKNMLNGVMEQMVMEYSMHNIPIEQKLDIEDVESTIKYELENNNINIPFEYAISDIFGNINNQLKSENFIVSPKSDIYSVQLFPSHLMQVPYRINILFPSKMRYMFDSLKWLLSISLLFTSIIIATFYYTLRTIFNQKKTSEVKNDFINNMTHEFKTPIATISLAADAISNPKVMSNHDEVKRFTSIIKEENKRMNRQVEGVLQMALLDKKDFNLKLNNIDVSPLIENAVNNIRLQIDQKGGSISLENNTTNSTVRIDETHFTNIINNLLDNANKYIGDKIPDIKVTVHNSPNTLYISISDNGIGMNKETLDKIFDKFYRHTSGNVHTVKGFGLGLSYVKAIVMSFKGNISAKSTQGIGSTFTIKLPLNQK